MNNYIRSSKSTKVLGEDVSSTFPSSQKVPANSEAVPANSANSEAVPHSPLPRQHLLILQLCGVGLDSTSLQSAVPSFNDLTTSQELNSHTLRLCFAFVLIH